MKEKEVLKLTFSKLYEEIYDVTYDIEDILHSLRESRLISEKKCRLIANKQESCEKNKLMIDALLTSIHNSRQFKCLLKILYADDNFCEIAENMKAVYYVLKNEETIVKSLNFELLFKYLKEKNFFENEKLEEIREVKHIIEILKEREFESFKMFLSCLKVLKQEELISLPESYPSSSLNNFRHHLMRRYTNSSFTEVGEVDFNLPISDEINIALIEISEENHQESTFFDYYSLLLKQESTYSKIYLNSYSDIVIENCRVGLIQGYPGSGKTYLAKRMCMKWARGELLEAFTYVVFLQLRDKQVANAKTIDELIEMHMGIRTLTKMIIDDIYECDGKGMLIILEGWDELPESSRHNSLFTRLISGDLMPEAVILITSRPSAIRSLEYKHIQRRIEILGFTEQQLKNNVTSYFKSDTKLVQQFYSELKRLPLLECFVFVPINLCVALYIFSESNHQLPMTFTDMYKNLVLIQLRSYQRRGSHGTASINTFDDIPKDIEDMLLRLSNMAYDHLQNDLTLIFSEKNIRSYCFNSRDESLDSFDGMGLLQVTNHKQYGSINKTYEFIHRTLQELLAAWYLSQQSKRFQQNKLQNIFNKKEFEMVWIFYAGLTKFKNVTFKELLPKNFALRVKMLSYKVFTWLLWAVVSNTFIRFNHVCKIFDGFFGGKQYSQNLSHCISREFQATLIAAVMEAQNPELCKEMCESYLFYGDTCWFCVPESALAPQLLSALSYCIAHSGKKWMIHSKGLDSYGADNLLNHLTCSKATDCKCSKCNKDLNISTDKSICVFDLNSSQSPVDGVVKLVKTQNYLQWIVLSYCKQVDDNFIRELTEALVDNTCLKMLHLIGCNVTGKSVKEITHMLKKNQTLEWIGLKNNLETLKEADIILLVRTIRYHNNTIYMLFLDNVFHTSPIIQGHLTMINVNRQQMNVKKLSLSLLDCFKYHESCQQFVSRFSFLSNKAI
ncbi:protein NLRC3-like isoform X2 [Dysidea avara]|uniref:protein NLRC3-like isoform X2 n=1 Tax=Dysidea avara TaxID=196820 RepID=UPI003326C097